MRNYKILFIFFLVNLIQSKLLAQQLIPKGFIYNILNFLFTVFILGLMGAGIIYCCHCIFMSNSNSENDKLYIDNFSKTDIQLKIEKINAFLMELEENNKKKNEESFENKCIICFDILKPTKKEEVNGSNIKDPKNEPLLDKEIELELTTFPLCEHTFHKKCIKEWWNKVGKTCPICSNQINEESIENTPRLRRKIVNIQKNIHPELSFINIDYTKNVINYKTPSHLGFKD